MFDATPLTEVLEKHIDRIGLPQFLETVAIVCDEKAEHIQTNWQDFNLSRAWAKASRDLDKAAAAAKARGIK